MNAQLFHAALTEILRRGDRRPALGPRAVAHDLASVAGRALGIEIRSTNAEQQTWTPEEQRPPQRKGRRA